MCVELSIEITFESLNRRPRAVWKCQCGKMSGHRLVQITVKSNSNPESDMLVSLPKSNPSPPSPSLRLINYNKHNYSFLLFVKSMALKNTFCQ